MPGPPCGSLLDYKTAKAAVPSRCRHPHRARLSIPWPPFPPVPLSPPCPLFPPGAAMPGPPCGSLLDYKTAKFSVTRNRRVGLLHRLLSALGYLLGWVLLLRKGYQERDAAPRVAVVTKVKGAVAAEAAGRRLWDAADLTWPPQGENVVFLVTHFTATTQQVQGTCPEVSEWTCPSSASQGWDGPTGPAALKPLLAEAENFTVFIKNTVHFTKFNFSRCNTLQTTDPSYFKSCTYDPVFNPFCPVFRVRDMVEAAGKNFGDLALLGGIIRVLIEWNCDLDHPATQCQPQYSFRLQDTMYNFRTASYYWGSQRRLCRSLLKLSGIRLDLSVHGQAGKFSIVPIAVSFGSSIAFFGAATMVCDLVLLYLDANADLYWKGKFEEVRIGSHGREKVLK
uniref:P2X purinoceptor n=1 Tax=Ficedula albicollis TaxID=59894 RepID=A0A803VKY1_FICAL